MYNCIFTPHCLETFCDMSCPILAETSYLLERNGIKMDSPVFRESDKVLTRANAFLANHEGKLGVYVVKDSRTTVQHADILTYCAICNNWRGSKLHCTVYNLRYSKYLDDLKKSWNNLPTSEDQEYVQIWAESAKVLIISNFDYVNFGDFECQTILNLIQSRQSRGLTTILVTPNPKMLVSTKNSKFFTRFLNIVYDAMDEKSNRLFQEVSR